MDRIKIVDICIDEDRITESFVINHNGLHFATLPEWSLSFYVEDGREAALNMLSAALSTNDVKKVYDTIFEFIYPPCKDGQNFQNWFEEKYGLTWGSINKAMQKSGVAPSERAHAFKIAIAGYYKEKD
jgi:hypothetical protein